MASKKATQAPMPLITLLPTGPNDLSEDNVMSVYSGRAGACCCGCAGKYSYAERHREAASKNLGYEVRDDSVSDRNVRRIVKLIKENAADADVCATYVAVTLGKRLYIAYLLPKN